MDDDFWDDTEGDCWFNAAGEGKKHDFLTEWQRDFAYKMGIRANQGKRPTSLQLPYAKEIWFLYQQFLRDQIAKNEECQKECYKIKSKDDDEDEDEDEDLE
jgi:hypothetical protein